MAAVATLRQNFAGFRQELAKTNASVNKIIHCLDSSNDDNDDSISSLNSLNVLNSMISSSGKTSDFLFGWDGF